MITDLTDLLDRDMFLDQQLKLLWGQIEEEWDLNGNSELFNAMQSNYFLMLEEKKLLQDQIDATSKKAA